MGKEVGYEPGYKKRRRGGITDEDHIKRRSEFPNIDIRHPGTFSAPKITLESFKHKPENWDEKPIEEMTPREREVAARISNCCCAGIDEDSDVCSQCFEHCSELGDENEE